MLIRSSSIFRVSSEIRKIPEYQSALKFINLKNYTSAHDQLKHIIAILKPFGVPKEILQMYL